MSGVDALFSVHFAALTEAAGRIAVRAARIEGRLAELERQLMPLRGDWSGSAAQAYEQARAQWARAAEQLRVLLAQLGKAVEQSSAEYLGAERLNAGRW